MATHDETATAALSADEQALLDRFMHDNRLFYGPDPEIMRDHHIAPRSAEEVKVLGEALDPHRMHLVRGRVQSALDESFTMVEQMGAAPGAKWGDLITCVFTASGDLSQIASTGIVVFGAVCHYPIRFIRKYWMDDPSVGVREGDGFIHNDSRYGNIHNTDQSLIMPLYWEGRLLCWIASTIHEGENGAIEPGGMPAVAESRYDEGLKMCPFKIVENFRIRRDILNFLQNSVRDPKLQSEDMKVKLHAVLRLRERIRAVLEEFGPDYLVATLRKNLEDTEAEVRRRIAELPDGTVRLNTFIDGTLREHFLHKMAIAIHVKGDKMTFDLRGSGPELTNRSINSTVASLKTCLLTSLYQYVWPDLPHNMAMMSPIDVVTDRNSLHDCSNDVPTSMSLIPLFRSFTLLSAPMSKLAYSLPHRYTAMSANHYNQPATFVYGGLTQHNEVTGNFCADINGNGGGARENADGEHALSPVFGFMADTGEMEIAEEELPYVRLVAQELARDRMGFGKYRGGMGYEQMTTVKESSFWGFMTGQCGAKHPSAYGLFGGYASPAYPLAKIKGINIFEVLKDDPDLFKFSMVELMNEQAIPGGKYIVHDAGMAFEPCAEGEVYMICQGAGGGYGDVLQRDPALVLKDVEENLLSPALARDIFKVQFDAEALIVDAQATRAARDAERAARKRRGRPYLDFVAEWVTREPPADLPYFGCWDDPQLIYASPPGGTRVRMQAGRLQGVWMSNPKDRRIAELEAELASCRGAATTP
ncbi:MAG: hydantoinase B/oxoprolinase family protein [Gammaproteobacteria bacterium]|nr:hydantoinase B/oxoprolinase family protein [Gammaproteobacteria bacterium]